MLFDPSLEPFSPTVRMILEHSRNDVYVSGVEKLWTQYQPYASPSFQREFLTNEVKFKPLFWEMFLTCKFLDHGFKVLPCPDDDRPDICLEVDGKNVWIECAMPTRGDPNSPDYEPELCSGGGMRSINHDASVLRCTSVLDAKYNQHKKWLNKGVCREGEPFIIALNGCNLDLRVYKSAMPGILRGLYAMGDLYTTFDLGGDESKEETGYFVQTNIVKKNESRSKVPTTFFLNEDHKNVTGVIFSTDWIMRFSSGPVYCYVENVNAENREDFGFDCFMQTYDYAPDKIAMKHT